MTMATISRAEEKLQLEDLHQYEEDIAGYCRQTLTVVAGGTTLHSTPRLLTTTTTTTSTTSFSSSLGGSGGGGGSIGGGDRSDSPPMSGGGGSGRSHHVAGVGMEQEKRIRREIANSNERRRMQSINAGFQSLRTLLPHHEGEKLSKAAILQQTAEYIYQLEQEKTRLLSQNCQLKRLVSQHTEGEASATKKRKAEEIEVDSVTGTTNDLIDVRVQLDRERRLRMLLEDQVRNLESQLYPERIREITQQVQLQYQHREDSSDVFTTSRSHFNQEGSLIISDSHDQDDKGSIVSGGAVITPMRRTSELLSASPETVAAVANLQVVAGGAAIQPVSHTETVIATVTGSPPASPSANGRITSILEAAIKAEPKVEVERLSPHDDRSTVYVASTSRQNLKTIVEAIRHLEGDNLENLDFSDAGEPVGDRGVPMSIDVGPDDDDVVDEEEDESEDAPPQDAPLALTTSNKSSPSSTVVTTVGGSSSPSEKHHGATVKVNMNQYLQFHQQQRPGVIVVKQHT